MQRVFNNKCLFAPSLICLDLCNLEQQVEEVSKSGIDVLHVDILDGRFSPSLPLGIDTVRQLRKKTSLAFDVHLMAEENDFFIDELLNIGVQQLTFHIESEKHVERQLRRIRNAGVRVGVALKPATSLASLDYAIELCDVVMLMLINPGYAGMGNESQVAYTERKITALRNMITAKKLTTKIEIDGRVSKENIAAFAPELVDIFVIGSTCLKKNAIDKSIAELFKLRRTLIGE